MKRKKPVKNRLKFKRPSDSDLDALSEPATADILDANEAWRKGAKRLKELLETPPDIGEGEEAS